MSVPLSVLLLFVCVVYGDIYMHNPRGSNDRLNENSPDRQNANRLFDSENNARGGYGYGPAMSYYAGSKLMLEWTAQHGCGSDQVSCNIVLQYFCQNAKDTNTVRDGTTTTTIPDDVNQYNQKDANGAYTYGMHESYQYYQDCKLRERNKGLFSADQIINGHSARFSRQNNNGARYGFECTEERDYYPYWHPAPWKDIAIFTDNKDRCDYYKAESQNVKEKGYCVYTQTNNPNQEGSVPNNAGECGVKGGTWKTVGSFGLSAPECLKAEYSRDNHLGNGQGAETARYNWTLPDEDCKGPCNCVFRLRYNISNFNIDSWGFSDSTDNGKASPVYNNPISKIEGTELQMALNTAQYGRTFEDRSHMFNIQGAPGSLKKGSTIHNLNVRGKRGNIVQTFPATEYDFVPYDLTVQEGDYIHFQWTGSDTNPGNNAGEGIAGTDRSNIVQIATMNENIPQEGVTQPLFESSALRYNMAFIGQKNCPTLESLKAEGGDIDQNPKNCAKLNAAPAYFNGGLVQMNSTGTYYYMSTRNNNFSNRSQKGSITVTPAPGLSPGAIAGIVIGSFFFVTISVFVGGFIFARKRPHTAIGRLYSRIPTPKLPGKFSKERTTPLMG